MSSLSAPHAAENIAGLTKYANDGEASTGTINNKALVPSNPLRANNLVGTIPPVLKIDNAYDLGAYLMGWWSQNLNNVFLIPGDNLGGSALFIGGISNNQNISGPGVINEGNGVFHRPIPQLPRPPGTYRIASLFFNDTSNESSIGLIQRIL